ncbi:hypothetical protein RHODGE_RHODGE_00449 [Rhodoplanes serenus]|uniref:Uncharacterized protein n=2 Tax=Nitrobacteraceae TaxID=41294 RepID=A0A3S4DD77_9BRAD|nr:hypothetical protein RHODGE_RHODGE_00449 [Rhodoplanes serenus]
MSRPRQPCTASVPLRSRDPDRESDGAMAAPHDDTVIEKPATEARQGTTGHNVRWVLATSLAAAVVLMAFVWFLFFSA